MKYLSALLLLVATISNANEATFYTYGSGEGDSIDYFDDGNFVQSDFSGLQYTVYDSNEFHTVSEKPDIRIESSIGDNGEIDVDSGDYFLCAAVSFRVANLGIGHPITDIKLYLPYLAASLGNGAQLNVYLSKLNRGNGLIQPNARYSNLWEPRVEWQTWSNLWMGKMFDVSAVDVQPNVWYYRNTTPPTTDPNIYGEFVIDVDSLWVGWVPTQTGVGDLTFLVRPGNETTSISLSDGFNMGSGYHRMRLVVQYGDEINPTHTNTPTPPGGVTPTFTPTPVPPTQTFTPTFTFTNTAVPSHTFTLPPTITRSPTRTGTPTWNPTNPTYTPTKTYTGTPPTPTKTWTPIPTDTTPPTSTYTPVPTITRTKTNTPVPTSTFTWTHTFTPTDTYTRYGNTPTKTPTLKPTNTYTTAPTITQTPTWNALTNTPLATYTFTDTPTFTPSQTPYIGPSRTPTKAGVLVAGGKGYGVVGDGKINSLIAYDLKYETLSKLGSDNIIGNGFVANGGNALDSTGLHIGDVYIDRYAVHVPGGDYLTTDLLYFGDDAQFYTFSGSGRLDIGPLGMVRFDDTSILEYQMTLDPVYKFKWVDADSADPIIEYDSTQDDVFISNVSGLSLPEEVFGVDVNTGDLTFYVEGDHSINFQNSDSLRYDYDTAILDLYNGSATVFSVDADNGSTTINGQASTNLTITSNKTDGNVVNVVNSAISDNSGNNYAYKALAGNGANNIGYWAELATNGATGFIRGFHMDLSSTDNVGKMGLYAGITGANGDKTGVYTSINGAGGTNIGYYANAVNGDANYDFYGVGSGNILLGDTSQIIKANKSNNTFEFGTAADSDSAMTICTDDGTVHIKGPFKDTSGSAGSAGELLKSTGTGTDWDTPAGAGMVTGTGTANKVTKFTGTSAVGNSSITDDGSTVQFSTDLDLDSNADPQIRFHNSDYLLYTDSTAILSLYNGASTVFSVDADQGDTVMANGSTLTAETIKAVDATGLILGNSTSANKLHINANGVVIGTTLGGWSDVQLQVQNPSEATYRTSGIWFSAGAGLNGRNKIASQYEGINRLVLGTNSGNGASYTEVRGSSSELSLDVWQGVLSGGVDPFLKIVPSSGQRYIQYEGDTALVSSYDSANNEFQFGTSVALEKLIIDTDLGDVSMVSGSTLKTETIKGVDSDGVAVTNTAGSHGLKVNGVLAAQNTPSALYLNVSTSNSANGAARGIVIYPISSALAGNYYGIELDDWSNTSCVYNYGMFQNLYRGTSRNFCYVGSAMGTGSAANRGLSLNASGATSGDQYGGYLGATNGLGVQYGSYSSASKGAGTGTTFYGAYATATGGSVANYDFYAGGTGNIVLGDTSQIISVDKTYNFIFFGNSTTPDMIVFDTDNGMITTDGEVESATFTVHSRLNVDSKIIMGGADAYIMTNNIVPLTTGTKIGGADNHTLISSAGNMTFGGTATYWDDLFCGGLNVKLGGSADPTLTTFIGGVKLYSFPDGSMKEVFATFQMPHNWKIGSTISPHVHWAASTTNAANCRWGLEYEWQDNGDTFAGTTTDYIAVAGSGTAKKAQISDFTYISGAGISALGSVLVCRIFRDGGNGADGFTGDAFLLGFDIHIECDSLGSNEEYTK